MNGKFVEEQLRLFREYVREAAPVSGSGVAAARGAIRFFGELSIEANRRLASAPADEAEKTVERWIALCGDAVLGTKDDGEEKREKNAKRLGPRAAAGD